MPRLLQAVRETLFPSVDRALEVWFVEDDTLASIKIGDQKSVIFIHAMLNHHKTPEVVFRLALVHELLHAVIAPRMVDGVMMPHPPEFFREEASLLPDRDKAWEWIWTHFYEALRTNKRQERTEVKRSWRSVWRRLNRPGEPNWPEWLRRPPVDFM